MTIQQLIDELVKYPTQTRICLQLLDEVENTLMNGRLKEIIKHTTVWNEDVIILTDGKNES